MQRGWHTKHMKSKLVDMGRVIYIPTGLDSVIHLFQNSKHSKHPRKTEATNTQSNMMLF